MKFSGILETDIMNTKAIGTVFEKKRDAYYDKLKKAGAEFI